MAHTVATLRSQMSSFRNVTRTIKELKLKVHLIQVHLHFILLMLLRFLIFFLCALVLSLHGCLSV